MELPICRTCGVQYDEAHFNPYECKICADERQYIGWDGQRWTTPAELRNEGRRGVVRQEEAEGPWGVGTEPSFAIGQRALLIPGLGGNVLWDSVSYLDDETIAAVTAHGGVAAIAVSHPHYYSSVVEWSAAFGDVPIYLHAAARDWVCRDGNIVFWKGESLEVLPGRTLVNAGVHFNGAPSAPAGEPMRRVQAGHLPRGGSHATRLRTPAAIKAGVAVRAALPRRLAGAGAVPERVRARPACCWPSGGDGEDHPSDRHGPTEVLLHVLDVEPAAVPQRMS